MLFTYQHAVILAIFLSFENTTDKMYNILQIYCNKKYYEANNNYCDRWTGSENNTVFLIYNEAGDEQLGLTVGSDVLLHYNDQEAHEDYKSEIKFNASINDGRWLIKQ